MTLEELIEEMREDYLEDNVAPYQWSDSQLIRYFNEAHKEACLRNPLLRQTQTITVAIGTSDYTLFDETQEIDEVTLALQTAPLTQSTHDLLTITHGLSWAEDEGTPVAFVRKDLTLTLYPEPIVADTMTVSSFIVPEKMVTTSQSPDIPERYHSCLCYYAAYKAFLNPDVDMGNVDRAMSFLTQFERVFGVKRSAKYDMIQSNTPKYNSVAPRRIA